MNPHLCRVVLRPRDPFEVFDLTFRLVREVWRPLLAMSLLVLLPLWLALMVGCGLTRGHWGLAVVPLVASAAVQAPFTMLVGRLLFQDRVGIGEVLRDVLWRLPALVGGWVVGIGGWLGSSLGCGILLPFVQMGLLYLPETALLERVDVSRGVRRSTRLAFQHVGISIVGALAWWVLTAWLAIVGEVTGQAIVSFVLQLGEPFGSLIGGYVTPWLLAGILVAQPLHAIYRLLLYVDVRTRVEGWDLQVALRAAGLQGT
jgi:hypothetical protein